MKKLVLGIIAACMAIITGCKTVWTTDESYKVGSAVGYTTAYVLNNQAKLDNDTRNAIIKITTEVQKYVPGSNETFTTAWTPIVNSYLDKLVADGKLTVKQAERVKKDFCYITTLLDSYVEKKGIKPYQDCVNAFIDGFITKFLDNFKPVNVSGVLCTSTKSAELDAVTYEYLSSKYTK